MTLEPNDAEGSAGMASALRALFFSRTSKVGAESSNINWGAIMAGLTTVVLQVGTLSRQWFKAAGFHETVAGPTGSRPGANSVTTTTVGESVFGDWSPWSQLLLTLGIITTILLIALGVLFLCKKVSEELSLLLGISGVANLAIALGSRNSIDGIEYSTTVYYWLFLAANVLAIVTGVVGWRYAQRT